MVVSVYLLVITLAAYTYRARRVPPETPIRFALAIPAHNEEHQIPAILNDTAALDYPKDCYRVFVIADNCTDRTAELVRKAGAAAVERTNPDLRGKGYALDWFIREYDAILAEYDAIAIVDADMHVAPGFLREISACFGNAEVQVVQARYGIAKPEKNWRSALGFAGFALINHVRRAGRARLGGTAELTGSGMAFRSVLLRERGWPAHSITEDIEFSKQLLADGISVHYAPDAIVTSELPAQGKQASVQQRRWEGGRFLMMRQFFPVFLRKALSTGQWRYVDALLDLVVPPLSILVLLLLALSGLSLLIHPLWTAVLLACLGLAAFCVVSGLIQCRAPLKVWLYLAAAPLYVLCKIPVFAGLIARGVPATWRRTPRDGEVDAGK